jgi:hypothetical protein
MLRMTANFLKPEDYSSISIFELTQKDAVIKVLCETCKLLSRNQMRAISDNGGWQGLWDWYKEHLLDDFGNNRDDETRSRIKKECARLNLEITEEKSCVSIKDGGYTVKQFG